MLILGTTMAVSAETVNEPVPNFVSLATDGEQTDVQAFRGCNYYCGYCEPVNGDGSCDVYGYCC